MTTNLIIFYLISIVMGASIVGIIETLKELKQWKKAYNKQKRIEKFMEEFEKSISNIEYHDDIDEYIREAILYD